MLKTESDNEIETLASMWKQLKQRMESRQEESHQANDTSRQMLPINTSSSPYAAKNYQIQIQALQEELYSKNNKLIAAQSDVNQLKDDNQQLIDTVDKLSVENQLLIKKTSFIEQQIDQIQEEKSSSRLIRLENESLRSDVKRLLDLLKKTKEYSSLNLEDTLTYVKGAAKYQFEGKTVKIRLQNKEEINWVPKRAKDLVQELFPEEEDKCNEIMLQLNSAYYNHYNAKYMKHKQNTNKEVGQLKRQLQSKTPFDGIQAQKQIERLKKQSNGQQSKSLNTAQLEDALNVISQKDNQIRVLTQQVQQLEDQLTQKEGGGIYKRRIFMEGAIWMLQKIFVEFQAYEGSIIDMNISLNSKIDELMQQTDIVQQQIINRVYKWISDTWEDLINGFKDKLNIILQSTESRLNSSVSRLE